MTIALMYKVRETEDTLCEKVKWGVATAALLKRWNSYSMLRAAATQIGLVAIIALLLVSNALCEDADTGPQEKLASQASPLSKDLKLNIHPHYEDQSNAFSQDLDDQRRILDAARQAVMQRFRSIHGEMSTSSQDVDNKDLLDKDATIRLVGIYENMSPREAAAVFNVMDAHVLVAIAASMNTRKLSAIMAHMTRDRVNMVSQYLIGVRRFHHITKGVRKEVLPSGLVISIPSNTKENSDNGHADDAPIVPPKQ